MSSKKGKGNPPPSEEEQESPERDKNPEENRKDMSQEKNENPEIAKNPEEEKEETPTAVGGKEDGKPTEEEPGEEGKASENQPDPDANLEWPEENTPSAEGPAPQEEVVVQDIQFDQIQSQPSSGKANNMDILLDVNLPISVQLGKTSMTIQELLEVGPGSVIGLDKTVGSPVEILANNKTIAQGEVVVVDENFGVRITSLISPAERIKSLR